MPPVLILIGAGVAALVGLFLSRSASATPNAAPAPSSGANVNTPATSTLPAFAITKFDPQKYRGIRNNNPGNIEWISDPAKRWKGMIRADGRYGVFDSAANGVRAIGGEIKASIRKGQNTIAAIITEWAPPSENPTAEYIAYVCSICGVSAHQIIDVYTYMPLIAQGIIKQENGVQPYYPQDIKKWVYA